jgi:hypothetical protein
MNTTNQPNVKFVQTPDYREAYSNSVQIRVNVWDFFLVFGTMQQSSETQVELRNFQGIYLSPQQAKALMALLQQNVTNYEAAFGEIKLDPRAPGWTPFTDAPFNGVPCKKLRDGRNPIQRKNLSRHLPHGRSSFFCSRCSFAGLMLLHAPLLRLPYFWDEAGYYVPAARDLFLTGALIPHIDAVECASSAGDGMAGAGLARFGYSTLVTRTAMLALSAFSLLGLFRLSRIAANLPVAWATTALVAVYPVYFTQSSMAQVDLPAAGFTFWALAAYVEDRPWKQVLWFSLAALAKETAILAPLALFGWELLADFIRRHGTRVHGKKFDGREFFRLRADARAGFIYCFPLCHCPSGTATIMRRRASCWATPSSFATTSPPRSIHAHPALLWE